MAAETAEAPPETPQEPAAAAPPAASKKAAKSDAKAKDAKKGGKDAKAAKGKGKKSADADASGANGPSIAAHPRAARAVARAKGWGGLIGFMLAGYLALPTNTLAGAGLRALVAGIVCYLAAWAGAVFLWRRLVVLEIKGREAQIAAAHAARARRELPAGPPSARAQG
ncbi:MAG: hypothetical protein ACLP1Q_01990 [Solirubrobacteraceae bacterium]